MATSDKLTGLANRQVFDVIAANALKDANRSGEPLSAMLIDIDHFKRVNDTYGHQAGDVVIQGVAKAAKASLRDSDTLCRWGGEEFLVVLKNCDVENARVLAEKLRQAVKEATFQYNETIIPVTVSLGIAEYQAGELIEHFLGRTDVALYAAKEGGRDRVCNV
jgi:diguanylate cyclase (GGDEF)-like protein